MFADSVHFLKMIETDLPDPPMQAIGEEAVREAFPGATIVRPADVYGHEDRFLRYYASLRISPFGMIPLLSRGKEVIKRPVYVSPRAAGQFPRN